MTLQVRTLRAEDYTLLSFDDAVALTESIRLTVAEIELKIVEAYYGLAWKVMGYDSWDEYISGEFKAAPLAMPREERRTSVASLRQAGLSLRAIGAATGVSRDTVQKDLEAVRNLTPDSITGIDGKEYPATRPNVSHHYQDARDLELVHLDKLPDLPMCQIEAEIETNTPPAQREACPTCGQKMPAQLQEGR